MKLRIATVLSLTGVLAAGSAAAMVNREILRDADTTNRVSVDSIVQSQFPVAVADPSQAPPAATQAVYLIGDAGAATLDVADGALTLVSLTPNEGWTVVSATNDDPTRIEVSLQSGTTVVEFHAALIFGVVNTSFETSDVAAPTTERPVTPGTSGGPVATVAPHNGGGGGSAPTVAPTTTPTTTDHDDDDDDDDHEDDDD